MNNLKKYLQTENLVQEEDCSSEGDTLSTKSSDIAEVPSGVKRKVKKYKKDINEKQGEQDDVYSDDGDIDYDVYGVDDLEDIDELDGDDSFEEDEEPEEDNEIKNGNTYDINGDGDINTDDILYMVKDLSRKALIEIIDLISRYFEDKFEQPHMVIPAEGRVRIYEEIINRVVGDKIVKGSSKLGHKLVNGEEKFMTNAEARERIKVALEKSKFRKAKKRKVSQETIEELPYEIEQDIEDNEEENKYE